MIIKNLRLENFKSYSKTQVEFNTGISIIMGENGAGKSSILEAVSFSLFKQHSGGKLENLVRAGQDKMKVELEFIANGRTYRVLREKGKTTSRAELRIKDGGSFQTIVTGDKQVSYEIENLLEMDSDLFLNAVYVRQGEIADLIDKKPSDKKQLIGKLLGIESLEKAWKNMPLVINDYKITKEKYKGLIEGMGDLNNELVEKNNQKSAMDTEILEIQSQIKEIMVEREKTKKEKEVMGEKKTEFEKLQIKIENQKDNCNRYVSREKELSDDLKAIEKNEKEMMEIEPEIQRLPDLNKLKESLSELTTLEREKNDIEESIKKIEKYQKILSDNQSYYEEYSDIQKKITDIDKQKSEFAGAHELLANNQKTRSKLQDTINNLKMEINSGFKDANSALGSELDKWEDIDKQLTKVKNAAEIKIKSLNTEIEDTRNKISNLDGLNNSITKPLHQLKTVEGQCPVCKSDIDNNKKNELLGEYIGEMNANKESIEKYQSSLGELESQKIELESRLKLINGINIDVLKHKSESLDQNIKELKETESQIESLNFNVSKLEELDSSLKSKKSRIEEINKSYSQYVQSQGALESAGDFNKYQDSLTTLLANISSRNEEISRLTTLSCLKNVDKEVIGGEISRLNTLNENYLQMKGSVDKKESIQEKLINIISEIKETKESINILNKSLDETQYDSEVHKKLIESHEDTNQRFIEKNGHEQELSGKLQALNENITKIEEELKLYKKYEAELISLNDFIKLLDHFRNLYGKDGIQKDLRNMSRPLIEQNTREFFDKFNFEYSDISLDEDYNIEVYGPVGKTTLNMISGGERIAVALALRLGITKALSSGNLELIMLDEPTIHLDTYRRQELIDILKRMNIIPQMIIVTHDADLEEAAENIIKVEKNEGTSHLMME